MSRFLSSRTVDIKFGDVIVKKIKNSTWAYGLFFCRQFGFIRSYRKLGKESRK